MREPVALDAKRGLKQQQDAWEVERKKAKFKDVDRTASGATLMFNGSGEYRGGCRGAGGADKQSHGSPVSNASGSDPGEQRGARRAGRANKTEPAVQVHASRAERANNVKPTVRVHANTLSRNGLVIALDEERARGEQARSYLNARSALSNGPRGCARVWEGEPKISPALRGPDGE